jgi:hypothetical protein
MSFHHLHEGLIYAAGMNPLAPAGWPLLTTGTAIWTNADNGQSNQQPNHITNHIST